MKDRFLHRDMKDEFIRIYGANIGRKGSEPLLDYLGKETDFFSAPASSRHHGAHEGGLLSHSLNVYFCLLDYLERETVCNLYHIRPSAETVAIAALLHDVCKVNCYQPSFRNVKDEMGAWQKTPSYGYRDSLPYGHGEKSVWIINWFMELSNEEAFAIRYHMGFSGQEDKRNVGQVFRRFPLAFALSTADMEASYFLEKEGQG